MSKNSFRLGAWSDARGTYFRLWAPLVESAELVWMGSHQAPLEKKYLQMQKDERGYFEVHLPEARSGGRYKFRLNSAAEIPDPASRFQPEGPEGPSQIVAPEFPWKDSSWRGIDLREMVIYELHVGSFSEAGDFVSVQRKLPHFKKMGINALEIMPVAQFSGERNWGYDGVSLFAVQNSYGGDEDSPQAFKRLIDACHAEGIAVILDVVYNHLGPEGNYLPQLGPYFQDRYRSFWGEALNYDGADSDEVRRFFLANARQWLEEFHLDGLRLDAIHAIFDTSAQPFLEELSLLKRDIEKSTGRKLVLIGESDANDARILRAPEEGGLGLDGQWADDLHHVLHSVLTGETQGYYADYGEPTQLARIYERGVYFEGQYSPYRRRRHGRSYAGLSPNRLVVCSQNHDQVGNRREGDRLIQLVGPEKARLAAAVVLLSPGLPLLFMGEEYGETRPFAYFVSHRDEQLLQAVREGRKKEFAAFAWQEEPPDPASPETFLRSKLDWHRADSPTGRDFMEYYRRLISLSKKIRREDWLKEARAGVRPGERVVEVRGRKGSRELQIFFNFSDDAVSVPLAGAPSERELWICSASPEMDLGASESPLPAWSALALSTGRLAEDNFSLE